MNPAGVATNRIGIRREDKNRWERRVPLVPDDVAQLVDAGLDIVVQPSDLRIFSDSAYELAGATVAEDLGDCGVVLAVKEIPPELFRPGVAYVYFSHTIKGQAHSMPALQAMLDTGGTLIDFERIADADGARLVHFGRFAGVAGTIDALWALGRRWQVQGFDTPLSNLRPTIDYPSMEQALDAVGEVGAALAADGLPDALEPLVVGITGYGHVAQGALEVLARLPMRQVGAGELAEATMRSDEVAVCVLTESDTVAPNQSAGRRGVVDVADFRAHPENYRSIFSPVAARLSLLINSIYWDPRAPRLLTWEDLVPLAARGRLAVIADLSCDIDGAIQSTVRATESGDPVYVVDPVTRAARTGFEGPGIVVLAVDNLPCELPADASAAFSAALRPLVPGLAAADFAQPSPDLPPELDRAMVAHRGDLTPAFEYLREPLDAAATA